jgi:serine/threonine-protein kinase
MLGRGGTCAVYRAWDTRLQRHVAIKRLQPPHNTDPHARARFSREGRAIARLSHPSLVTLIDRGSTENDEYLVFEYIEGRSLKDLVKRDGPLDPMTAAEIAGQVAEGLAHAHLAGLVHRDVKPQNILLDAEGRAKLTDFGIATADDWTHVTRAGAIVGSSRYMSPEQVQGRPVDLRSDIYSLGIVMYEMLAGAPPFNGANLAEIGRMHVREHPRPLRELRDDLPEGLERVVLRCLEKLPENRFQSADELLGALVGLDLHTLERQRTGLLASLRRAGVGTRDSAVRSSAWAPPAGAADGTPTVGGRGDGEAVTAGGDADLGAESSQRRADRRTDALRQRRHAERRRWRPALQVLVVAVVVVALSASLYSILFHPHKAPILIGQTLDQARAAATKTGLRLEVVNKSSLTGTAGMIVQQDPAAGKSASDGVVKVTVLTAPTPVTIASIVDLDPEGDSTERPDLLPLLSDGKDSTAWSTEQYGSATFGGLKKGVGLLFKLSGPATMVEVVASDTGWVATLQTQAADGSWHDLAALNGEPKEVISLTQPITTGRIWITRLVDVGGGHFATRFGELRFYR